MFRARRALSIDVTSKQRCSPRRSRRKGPRASSPRPPRVHQDNPIPLAEPSMSALPPHPPVDRSAAACRAMRNRSLQAARRVPAHPWRAALSQRRPRHAHASGVRAKGQVASAWCPVGIRARSAASAVSSGAAAWRRHEACPRARGPPAYQ
eukprot:scaffold103471_cov26-Tisochrysis_lutea.AAC.1